MKATTKGARELEQKAKDFNHAMLPKRGKFVIEVSASYLADVVERLEKLEAMLCQGQETTGSQ